MKTLSFNFGGYSGWDVFRTCLPHSMQARSVAKRWLKSMTTPEGIVPDPVKTPMIINMPFGSYKILNQNGDVSPCSKSEGPLMPV